MSILGYHKHQLMIACEQEPVLSNKPNQFYPQASSRTDNENPGVLLSRIAQLEEEQQIALDRIDELNQAKLSVELALAHLNKQKNKDSTSQASTDRLENELQELVRKKEREQEKLREKIQDLKIKAKHEVERLEIERDVALARAKGLEEDSLAFNKPAARPKYHKWLEYASIGVLVTLGLITLILLIWL